MTRLNRKNVGKNAAAIDRYVDLHGKDEDREPEQALFPAAPATVAAVDRLKAKCWCEHCWIWIPQPLAKQGLTLSCGATKCVSPDGDRTEAERVQKWRPQTPSRRQPEPGTPIADLIAPEDLMAWVRDLASHEPEPVPTLHGIGPDVWLTEP